MKKTLIICAVLVLSMVMSQPAEAVDVPLVAGQDMPVGHVTVEQVNGDLRVEYVLDEELYELYYDDCGGYAPLELEEIHLHVAYDAGLIPQNKKGLPQIGNFEYNGNPTVIALGDIPGVPGDPGEADTVYIAAHAVVSTDSDFCDICVEAATHIIDGDEVCIDYVEDDPGDSYFEVTIDGKTYPTWCVDIDHSMSLGDGPTAYPFCFEEDEVVTLYSSTCAPDFYPLPTELTTGYGNDGGIDREGNLDLALWILNEWHKNHPAGWNVLDIQQVIWHLLEDDGDVDLNDNQEAILAAALAAEIPELACCDLVGVIFVPPFPPDWIPEDGDDEIRQLAMILVPAPCCIDETAWALSGYPDDRDGILFAPAGPKGKRSGSWAEYFTFPVVQPVD